MRINGNAHQTSICNWIICAQIIFKCYRAIAAAPASASARPHIECGLNGRTAKICNARTSHIENFLNNPIFMWFGSVCSTAPAIFLHHTPRHDQRIIINFGWLCLAGAGMRSLNQHLLFCCEWRCQMRNINDKPLSPFAFVGHAPHPYTRIGICDIFASFHFYLFDAIKWKHT